jgi:hypothetical protein
MLFAALPGREPATTRPSRNATVLVNATNRNRDGRFKSFSL